MAWISRVKDNRDGSHCDLFCTVRFMVVVLASYVILHKNVEKEAPRVVQRK